jgi:hypothetical protein
MSLYKPLPRESAIGQENVHKSQQVLRSRVQRPPTFNAVQEQEGASPGPAEERQQLQQTGVPE